MPVAGDKCTFPRCDGKLEVYSTHINFAREERIRYMRCDTCLRKPDHNKQRVPLDYAPARRKAV